MTDVDPERFCARWALNPESKFEPTLVPSWRSTPVDRAQGTADEPLIGMNSVALEGVLAPQAYQLANVCFLRTGELF